jgi:hypothetical protein
MSYKKLVQRTAVLEKTLDGFALLEQFKGNPAARAGLPLDDWPNLPPDIARLWDEYLETSYLIDHLVNRAMRERGQNRLHLYIVAPKGWIN